MPLTVVGMYIINFAPCLGSDDFFVTAGWSPHWGYDATVIARHLGDRGFTMKTPFRELRLHRRLVELVKAPGSKTVMA